MQSLGGRKFIMSVVILLIGVSTALIRPEALSVQLVSLLLGVLATFSAGNAWVSSGHFKSQTAKALAPKQAKPEDNSEIKRQIAAISQLQADTARTVLDLQNGIQQYVSNNLKRR